MVVQMLFTMTMETMIKNKYSTYVELSYPFIKNSTVNLNGFVGSAFVFNGKEGNYSLYGNGEKQFPSSKRRGYP